MEKEKKAKITKEQKVAALNKIFYKIKNVFGTPSILLYPAFILKALGTITLSHIMDVIQDTSFTLSQFLRHLTCCYNSSIKCINHSDYGLVCTLLYIILLLPFLIFYVIYIMELKKKNRTKIDSKYINKS